MLIIAMGLSQISVSDKSKDIKNSTQNSAKKQLNGYDTSPDLRLMTYKYVGFSNFATKLLKKL